MAQWIRVIAGLPIVEIKPTGNKGFSPEELMMLLGTSEPSQIFPTDDGLTVLLYDDESEAPINERACALLKIPTARELRERVIANGVKPDEALLARADDERAWEIRGNVLLARVGQESGETAEEKLTEQLADQAHASWSHWMQYLFSKSTKQADGSVVIPGGLVARWERQMNTPYGQLAEQEKQSDREQAAAFLPIISDAVNG